MQPPSDRTPPDAETRAGVLCLAGPWVARSLGTLPAQVSGLQRVGPVNTEAVIELGNVHTRVASTPLNPAPGRDVCAGLPSYSLARRKLLVATGGIADHG